MRTDKDRIIESFYAVRDLGYVKSLRKNNTGIGKTFEEYIGVVENNIDAPDLYGYEIKSHREEASSYITLFTKAPTFPRGANAYLKDRFGEPYDDNPELKRLHTSMFADHYNSYCGRLSFRLINVLADRSIRIGIYDIATKALIDDSVGYKYEIVEKALRRKMKNLFYVSAKREYRGDDEYFHFDKAEIYSNPSFDKFLGLLDDGKIMYDIRIGSYKSGRNYGKPHDHGSCFRLLEANLCLLYDTHEVVL